MHGQRSHKTISNGNRKNKRLESLSSKAKHEHQNPIVQLQEIIGNHTIMKVLSSDTYSSNIPTEQIYSALNEVPDRQNDPKAFKSQKNEIPPIVRKALKNKSDGNPLGDKTRTSLERRFRHGFQNVRLHTNNLAMKQLQKLKQMHLQVATIFGLAKERDRRIKNF